MKKMKKKKKKKKKKRTLLYIYRAYITRKQYTLGRNFSVPLTLCTKPMINPSHPQCDLSFFFGVRERKKKNRLIGEFFWHGRSRKAIVGNKILVVERGVEATKKTSFEFCLRLRYDITWHRQKCRGGRDDGVNCAVGHHTHEFRQV